MKRTVSLGIAALFLLCGASALSAFSFEPITRDFSPSGKDSIRTFRLANSGSETIMIRIRILTREVDSDGREVNDPADSLFTVYPSRVVLAPRSLQAVKVQWKGPPDLLVERCFRILAEQLPVRSAEEHRQGGNIRVMFRYLGAIYIVPKGARPNVVVESTRSVTDPSGRKGLEILFCNQGNAHTLLNNLQITLSRQQAGASARKVYEPDELEGINGENLLPGLKRRTVVPLPLDLQGDGLDVSFHFESVR
jgi:fimbrial chaperone protein